MSVYGQAAIDLDTFRKSELMKGVRSCIEEVIETGVNSVLIVYEMLGTSREGIFVVTILREEGFEVKWHKHGILVTL